MDAVEFVKQLRRMDRCESRKYSVFDDTDSPEDVVVEVEQWSKEHPHKTLQSVFLEQWPDAKVFIDGILDLCPLELDKHYPCQSTDVAMRCQSCRREFWMQEVE